jgi:hypothetical protein
MRSNTAILLSAAALLAACDRSPAEPAADLLAQVRAETARFSAVATAQSAGYEADPHCVAHPQLGGMGYHYVNGPLIDPQFDPLRPEALLYERTPAGALQLIGVEYIVVALPGQDLEGSARPRFDGHPFDIGGVPPLTEAGVPHWSLHVWAHKANASGTFAPFNPAVTCAAG